MYNLNQTAPFIVFLAHVSFSLYIQVYCQPSAFDVFIYCLSFCYVWVFCLLLNWHRHVSGIVESCSVSVTKLLSTHASGLAG